jgi:dTDP-4-amino-4,6-dideoxygalactose transaminase
MMLFWIGGELDSVEFFTFKSAPNELREEWRVAISEVVDAGQFIGGPIVTKFENEWAKYLDVNHVIGVGNGYDAIVVALKVLGIGPGDFVAVPSHTFIATWLAVGAVGATPIGIDCDAHGLIDLDLLENLDLTLAAVIPVHMHGQCVDMPRLVAWSGGKDIKVIEDCAQAHGAKIGGKLVGSWGDFAAFSFYPSKNLGALGDGGALATSNDSWASKARSYVNYGSTVGDKYSYQINGINSRLDPVQAAVLSVNLKHLDAWNLRRKQIARRYNEFFLDNSIPNFQASDDSVYHHYIALSDNRDETRDVLLGHGIKTESHYPECARNSFAKFNKDSHASTSENAEKMAALTLSLPISQWMTDKEVDYVLEVIKLESSRLSFRGGIQ